MKAARIVVLAFVAALSCGCASAPMPGAARQNNFSKLVRAIFDGKVSLADEQIEGVTVSNQSVAEAIVAGTKPGLEGLASLALGEKIYKAGWILTVTRQGQTKSIDILCTSKQAEKCASFPPNVPVTLYATPIPFSEPGGQVSYLLRCGHD